MLARYMDAGMQHQEISQNIWAEIATTGSATDSCHYVSMHALVSRALTSLRVYTVVKAETLTRTTTQPAPATMWICTIGRSVL